uniref:Poly [ADP-ribose] polymerase n=1 Tax=Callorhinchus milii TaxID=7868 RepID=A0A4W3I2E9_CALMI
MVCLLRAYFNSIVNQTCCSSICFLGSQPYDGVVVTGGGQLQCLYIVHMVGPTTAALITAAVEKTLRICDHRNIATVAFPAIGTGKPSWTPMNDQEYLEVPLQFGSAEYNKVANEFTTSCQNIAVDISQIDRIQNRKLWQSYSVRKQTVDRKYPNALNEQILYHGTSGEIADKVNKLGFNRSFWGRNAVHYGKGTYFAKNAHYSCDDNYSSPSDQGYKYMFQTRVITGKMCLGNKSMMEPTPVDPDKDPNDLCDCAVDNISNPSVFVIFSDDGAYPEYLITFQI